MALLRLLGSVTLSCLLAACSGLSVFDGPARNHISVVNRSGYVVSITADGRRLNVALDTQSAVEKRLLWAGSFGMADSTAQSEFDTAARDWLRFERPKCKAENGRRISFVLFEYDLTCEETESPT